MMKRDLHKLIKTFLCVLLIDACGGTLGGNPEKSDPDTGGTVTPGTGTFPPPGSTTPAALTFSITDAPVEDARNVYISVDSVQVAQTDGAWVTIPLKDDAEIDLLTLQDGTSSVLAAITTLPAGTYNQTRLVLDAAAPGRLIDKDGVEHALEVPSGSESGLKIASNFTIAEGTPVELTIDFDLRKSIKSTGNGNSDNSGKGNKNKYMLKPVLRLTDDSKTGELSGQAADGSVICLYANNAQKDVTDSCDNAITSATAKNGKYKFGFMEAGTYDLRVFSAGVFVQDIEDVVISVGKEAEDESGDDKNEEE